MIVRRSPMGRPVCSSGNSTFSSTVHQGNSAKSWKTNVSGLRLPGGGAPRHSALPPLGCKSPPRIDSSVLLPQPDGPTIATTSPARTVNDTSSSTASAPKRWLIWSDIRSMKVSLVIAMSEATEQSMHRHSGMVRQHQTSDVQLHIGESRDSGFDASHRPGMTKLGLPSRALIEKARHLMLPADVSQ